MSTPRAEFVRVPAELVDLDLPDEVIGFVVRALRLAWHRGMTRQRSRSHGKPIPLSRQDLLALTKRGRVDHARAFLARLPPEVNVQLGASWSLAGELAGVLGRGKCPALKVSAERVSHETASLLPPAQRGGTAPPQPKAKGSRPAPRAWQPGPQPIAQALREVMGT